MRVSARPEDNANHHLCGIVRVFLHGCEIRHAVAADTDEGWVEIYQHPIGLFPMTTTEPKDWDATVKLYGPVTITHPELGSQLGDN